jgi:hypothetical protein
MQQDREDNVDPSWRFITRTTCVADGVAWPVTSISQRYEEQLTRRSVWARLTLILGIQNFGRNFKHKRLWTTLGIADSSRCCTFHSFALEIKLPNNVFYPFPSLLMTRNLEYRG